MKKLIFILSILTVITVIVSCNKNLNLNPQSSYSSGTVWSDVNLVQTYVNQQYADVMPNLLSTNILDLSTISSNAYCRFNYSTASIIQKGQLSASNESSFGSQGQWDKYWKSIRNANIFFQKIGGVSGDAATKKRLTGEMHFIRAWSYFNLIKRYGGVPIIQKVFKLGGNFKVKRSSYDDCVHFIVADLDTAATDLPVSYSNDSNIGRATKGAAFALKSRVLLFDASPLNNPSNNMSKWKKAADAAKAVIDMGAYHLYTGTNYSDIFLKNWTSGIIFARDEPSNGAYGGQDIQTDEAPNGFHGWSAHSPSQNLVNAFLMKNGNPISDPNSGYDPKHPYKNRGPRFYADIVYNGATFYGHPHVEFYKGGKSSAQGIDNWNSSLTKYTLKKYFNQNRPIGAASYSTTEVPLIRLAEVYLNYAEAEYHLGKESTARHYLNELRERPSINLPDLPSTLSGSKLLSAIRRARRLDLSFEGHYYWDILRWKRAMKVLNGSLNGMMITKNPDGSFNYKIRQVIPLTFKKRMYRFPLPLQVEQKTDLKQNPGYSK
jgi:hypothetical protein